MLSMRCFCSATFMEAALMLLHAMLFNSEPVEERSALLSSSTVPVPVLLEAMVSSPQPADASVSDTIRVVQTSVFRYASTAY